MLRSSLDASVLSISTTLSHSDLVLSSHIDYGKHVCGVIYILWVKNGCISVTISRKECETTRSMASILFKVTGNGRYASSQAARFYHSVLERLLRPQWPSCCRRWVDRGTLSLSAHLGTIRKSLILRSPYNWLRSYVSNMA